MSASISPGGTRRPFWSRRTISRQPGVSVVTQARAQDAASINTLGNTFAISRGQADDIAFGIDLGHIIALAEPFDQPVVLPGFELCRGYIKRAAAFFVPGNAKEGATLQAAGDRDEFADTFLPEQASGEEDDGLFGGVFGGGLEVIGVDAGAAYQRGVAQPLSSHD